MTTETLSFKFVKKTKTKQNTFHLCRVHLFIRSADIYTCCCAASPSSLLSATALSHALVVVEGMVPMVIKVLVAMETLFSSNWRRPDQSTCSVTYVLLFFFLTLLMENEASFPPPPSGGSGEEEAIADGCLCFTDEDDPGNDGQVSEP